jgi:hypothetical protein
MDRRMVGRLGVIGMDKGKESCVQSVKRSVVGADEGLSMGRKDTL